MKASLIRKQSSMFPFSNVADLLAAGSRLANPCAVFSVALNNTVDEAGFASRTDWLMTRSATDLLYHIRRLVAAPAAGAASDASLLERFCTHGDEAAFTALVARYGPLVFHVCRRLLRQATDAEDAFQATFLILARKANRIWPRENLAAWLYGVARRVALQAHAASRQQPEALVQTPPDPHGDPLAEVRAREFLTIIDEEVRRLPRVYRLPVILCCLEDYTLEQAASQLGWTVGSVKGRLERGRQRLQRQLLRRGVALSAVLAVVRTCQAGVPSIALAMAVKVAMLSRSAGPVASIGSAHVLALAEGVLSTMRWSKWTLVLAVALGTALAGTGVALVARPGGNGAGAPKRRLVAESQPHLAVPLDKNDGVAKKLKAWREERLAAARTADATSLAQYTAGRILLLRVYLNSRQLLDAELGVAKTEAERLRAYRDHRDRMKKQ